MSISGRRAPRMVTGMPKRAGGSVTKLRRTQAQAYTSNWHAISEEVKRRAGYRCQKCGKGDCILEADHIIPVSKGGLTIFLNLRALCKDCHDKCAGHKHLFKQRTLKRKKR